MFYLFHYILFTCYQCALDSLPVMKMVTVTVTAFYFSLLGLVVSASALSSTCGPEACGLTCAEDESCVQDLEVRGDSQTVLILVSPLS